MKLQLDRIDVEHMLTALGVQNVAAAGDEVYYSCPFPGHAHGDEKQSASMSTAEVHRGGHVLPPTTFNCWGCGAHGNAVTFVSMLLAVPPWTAKRWLVEAYGGEFREPVGALWDELKDLLAERQEEQVVQRVTPDEVEADMRRIDWNRFGPAHQGPALYMLTRGFDPKTLQDFDVGWDHVSGRVSIPVRDEQARLVGFKGRATMGEQPKYKVLGGPGYGFDTYEVGQVVFGSHMGMLPGWEKRTVICEGELNVMALRQARVYALATGGAKVSARQLQVIKALCDGVILWFDDDPAGRAAMARHLEELYRVMPVRYVTSDKDPADLSAEKRRELAASAVHPMREWIDSLLSHEIV